MLSVGISQYTTVFTTTAVSEKKVSAQAEIKIRNSCKDRH